MNFLEKKRELQSIIEKELVPQINSNYVLWGLPYYTNIGDTLIWEGEIELLKKTKGKCKGVCAWNETFSQPLDKDTIILISGGGFFGDLWRTGWEFALKTIENYKDHEIIVFPCSIYYEDPKVREEDVKFLSGIKKLTIYVRDRASLEYGKRYFKNEIRLIPDMAFCMSEKTLLQWSKSLPTKNALYLKREDKESVEAIDLGNTDHEVSDWITMTQPIEALDKFYRNLQRTRRLKRISGRLYNWVRHYMYYRRFRNILTEEGCRQLSSYQTIYSTRLHGMILSTMLGRDTYFVDNSYGKVKALYDTWLQDCDNVKQF